MDIPKMYSREVRLIGAEAFEKLSDSKVMICGLGGVGGGALEALARAGVGTLVLVDNDTVDETNLNRQLVAINDFVGKPKTEAAKKRVLDIRPLDKNNIVTENLFITRENARALLEKHIPDYVIDAIDNVSAKIALAVYCEELGIPLISSMGTGNKLNPAELAVSDIYKTDTCPLARVMRRELKARGVKSLKTVWSREIPRTPVTDDSSPDVSRTPASVSFVPPVAGMIIASEVVKDICGL